MARSFQVLPRSQVCRHPASTAILDPSRDIRSSGAQSFTLFAPSTVETLVNGRSLERKLLQPGTYTLQDFPLAEGANDVRLRIEDETGRQRTVEFNLYSNRQLLEPGATEFSASGGVYANPTAPASPTRDGGRHRSSSPRLVAATGRGAQRAGGCGSAAGWRRGAVRTSLGLIGVDLAEPPERWAVGRLCRFHKLRPEIPSGPFDSLLGALEYRSR